MPFSMFVSVSGKGSPVENFDIKEQEVKISQASQIVFQIKYGITKVKSRLLILPMYFLLSYPLKKVRPESIKKSGTANFVIEEEKKKDTL